MVEVSAVKQKDAKLRQEINPIFVSNTVVEVDVLWRSVQNLLVMVQIIVQDIEIVILIL